MLDAEVGLNRPTSEELIRKMCQNLNMLGELALIGSVEAVAVNIPGVPEPIPTVHQFCDGSAITELTSPFVDGNTPDMRNRFVRGADASTNSGNELGGASTVNLAHNHGGATATDCFPVVGADGGEHYTSTCHYHAITSDLSAAEPLNPANVKVEYFLKIT